MLEYDNLLGNSSPENVAAFFIFLLGLFAAAIEPCIETSPPNSKPRLFEGIKRLNLPGISTGLKFFIEISTFIINNFLPIKYSRSNRFLLEPF